MSVETALNVSVIIPVYNGADYVKRCLEAVFASADPSYECIVVNDGSTDASKVILEDFSDRIRLLNLAEGPWGPAYARNRGAAHARGEILFFVDADVVLAGGALGRVATTFSQRPDLVAIIGSYDASPAAPGLVSQYRNLLHHFVHQNGNPDASTFWAGCGAIRRNVFERVGGFDQTRFLRPSIEDIELGYRLRALGLRILLDKGLQGTHLKCWNLSSMIRTDISQRALPWSRLILETKKLPNDLNLQWKQRLSFVLVILSCLLLPFALVKSQWIVGSAAAFLALLGLNRKLYLFFLRHNGALFALACVGLHLLYYLYSGFSYVYVWIENQLRRGTTIRPMAALKSAARLILSVRL